MTDPEDLWARRHAINDEVYSSIQKDKNWGFENTYLNETEIKFGKAVSYTHLTLPTNREV